MHNGTTRKTITSTYKFIHYHGNICFWMSYFKYYKNRLWDCLNCKAIKTSPLELNLYFVKKILIIFHFNKPVLVINCLTNNSTSKWDAPNYPGINRIWDCVFQENGTWDKDILEWIIKSLFTSLVLSCIKYVKLVERNIIVFKAMEYKLSIISLSAWRI